MSVFGRALTRELRHLRHDRWDLAALFVIPAILLALMAGMLWQGTMHKLPLAVVDSDGTTASRTMIRALDASPMIRIDGFYQSEADAMRVLRSGEAMALVHLPPGLGEGLARDREPVVRILYNASFLSTGRQISSAAESALQTAALEILAGELPNHGLPSPRTQRLVIEATALGNAPGSYEWFLGLLIYPSVLHLVAACATAMALGRELRDRSLASWAQSTGGVASALAGKMLPYVVVVSLWGVAWMLWLTLARGWRFEGSIALIAFAQVLLYAGTAAISALLIAITRDTPVSLSAGIVYAGSALAYSGATLPLNGGSLFARVWSNVLPLPHYLALQLGQVSDRAITLTGAIVPIIALTAYLVIAGGGAVAIITVASRRS
ncbi:ABC transporter permease [Altericroceibacterium endophyticum]|uniref:ABC transporter permease n=1 Tax=Altericroceibacterium endophyticum TaxID=1808508 RepID=A0A6I4T1G2_9SPHN|nr:ABC transporter permease [Altericroceibacterium endophyticum]MXO64797.1 ABC transporter permease [Altericroceibacterium endophyticum]